MIHDIVKLILQFNQPYLYNSALVCRDWYKITREIFRDFCRDDKLEFLLNSPIKNNIIACVHKLLNEYRNYYKLTNIIDLFPYEHKKSFTTIEHEFDYSMINYQAVNKYFKIDDKNVVIELLAIYMRVLNLTDFDSQYLYSHMRAHLYIFENPFSTLNKFNVNIWSKILYYAIQDDDIVNYLLVNKDFNRVIQSVLYNYNLLFTLESQIYCNIPNQYFQPLNYNLLKHFDSAGPITVKIHDKQLSLLTLLTVMCGWSYYITKKTDNYQIVVINN